VLLLVVAVIMTLNINLSGGTGPTDRPDPIDSGDRLDAWIVCQDFVLERLTAPATADFPTGYADFTSVLSDERFRVESYVDAENSFGAFIRTDFVCVVRYTGNGSYRLEGLIFEE